MVATALAACSDPAATGGPSASATKGTALFDGGTLLDGAAKADAKAADLGTSVADDGSGGAQPGEGFGPDGLATTAASGTADAAAVLVADAANATDGPGAGPACQANDDCPSGFCVETAAGLVCAPLCGAACPSDWQCKATVAANGDAINVCFPVFARLCDPCSGHAACNAPGAAANLCLPAGPTGSFCGVACDPAAANACPAGFGCVAAASGATPTYQCVRKAGDCPCSAAAVAKQLATVCSHDNAAGSCKGTRTCASGALSVCDAAVPAAETCNGQDDDCDGTTDTVATEPCEKKSALGICLGKVTGCANGKPACDAKEPAVETCNAQDDDCDGKTDEDLCEDGSACTQGKCNPDGSCQQAPVNGPKCDDGNVCTELDVCKAGACQGGGGLACDDQNACSADTCDPLKGCAHAPQDGACADDGNPCTLDQCANGKCAHPAASSGAACPDDGKPCTADTCAGSACTHPPKPAATPCPDDGNACTVDACDGVGACNGTTKDCSAQDGPCTVGQCSVKTGACSAAPQPGACDDANPCTVNDQCGAGMCSGTAKDCSALANACNAGQCSAGQCVQKAKAGGCDDGDACTAGDACGGGSCKGKALDCSPLSGACAVGLCAGGQCTAQLKANGTGCDDGNPCTATDVCKTGTCGGAPKDCSASGDACNVGVCTNGACAKSPKPAGSACSDGNPCTLEACSGGSCKATAIDCSALADACNDGVCAGGACLKKTKNDGTGCSDGNACTDDQCKAGKCTGAPKNCSASADVCNDAMCAGGVCGKKPKATGTPCTDGSTCTTGDACSGGACTGNSTADGYEPNATSPGKVLAAKGDCDEASSLSATISPGSDIDWFTFAANDNTFCTIKPSVALKNLAADYDVCIWFKCSSGKTGEGTVSCVAGAKVSGGPGSTWGCCSTNSGTTGELAKLAPTCSFGALGDESGTVSVRVQPKAGAVCGGYSLEWSAKN
ncbi:MAG: hypothetical protein EXR79_01840 [Myxococcales bacterium]|nr:hypothetical protein [Myxococcales bacterium]